MYTELVFSMVIFSRVYRKIKKKAMVVFEEIHDQSCVYFLVFFQGNIIFTPEVVLLVDVILVLEDMKDRNRNKNEANVQSPVAMLYSHRCCRPEAQKKKRKPLEP